MPVRAAVHCMLVAGVGVCHSVSSSCSLSEVKLKFSSDCRRGREESCCMAAVKCTKCGSVLSYDLVKTGTSSLKKHTQACKKKIVAAATRRGLKVPCMDSFVARKAFSAFGRTSLGTATVNTLLACCS